MKRRAHGFTLIEVLLATVLLAAGLALAFATLRAATATAQRGETLAQRSERMRAVEGFLRRRLASALPMAYAVDPSSGVAQRFVGERQRMRFVADVPDYLGRGGPYLHDLAASDEKGLTIGFAMIQAGKIVEERATRAPETLVPDLQSLRLRYRGLKDDGSLGDWQDDWQAADRLPLQISVEIRSASIGAWPPLVVALPQAGREASSQATEVFQ
ncbi:prepilin-type N-terminal cleavage/methylation domain-containing protein [Luteimonas sp. SX5]|uniref:Prepilin-type N-terminal cleavage/methylation domain-containing protein n=1 Tax=Luteimonas galliterrae TaxID=2940486 RepID=A0ABT0MMV1_9GAMM|nr:prepilin-type N-terminal cleavage/methylation domain-containing protein [Luteimonas galliterrae]MCL1636187.1 prepilin-type N-terminal cleavage/methylation domain-containing protein [Luteimonas galliterrae]